MIASETQLSVTAEVVGVYKMQDDVNERQSQLEELEESLKLAIVEGFVEVPMLPEVAHRALILAKDPESTASEMAELVQSDQSLAGHVMRIANSVAYTPLSNLVSLQQAISRLGMNVISEIALSAVLSAKLFNTPGFEDYVEYNWQHALATSLWSKEIARLCKLDVEVSFLAGLLHSIGRPAVLQTILELAKQQNKIVTPEDVHRLENKYSQRVTELVVTRWKMPTQVLESIKPYNEQEEAAAYKIAAAVHVGSRFATYMLELAVEDDKETLMQLPVLRVLGLNQEQVEQLFTLEETIQQRLDGMSL